MKLKIHTLEMVKDITDNIEEQILRNKLKDIQRIFHEGETYTMWEYVGLCTMGIKIYSFYYQYRRNQVILQINPQTVLGMDGKSTLFEVDYETLEQCFFSVEKILKEYQVQIDDFTISRIDFTRDIQFEKKGVVDSIINLLRKTGAPYRYHMTKYGGREYENSYDITDGGDSIVVYNKEKQYAEMEGEEKAEVMKGVMRIEVRTAVEESIYQNGKLDYSKVITSEEYAEQIIRNVFIEGFYIKLKRMKSILQAEYRKRRVGRREKQRIEKVLTMVEKIALHRSLKECIRGNNACFGYETIQIIRKELVKRRMNIVTISAKEDVQVIPDIMFLLGMKDEEEIQKDNEFLIKYNLKDKIPKYHLR